MNPVVLSEAQLTRSMQEESKVNTNFLIPGKLDFSIPGKLDFPSLWGRPVVKIAT